MSKNNSEIQVGQLNVYFYFIIILCNNWFVIFPQIKTDHRQKYLIYMIACTVEYTATCAV